MIRTLRIGTRGSALALWQANTVATLLALLYQGLVVAGFWFAAAQTDPKKRPGTVRG